MKGILLNNAYFDSKEYLYQADRLAEELNLRGVETQVLANDGFFARIEGGEIVSDFDGVDFCVCWDKDKYVLRLLEKKGMRIFNSRSAIEKCDDKMLTFIELADNQIPMPDTLPGLLCYRPDERIKPSAADRIEQVLGYPLVAKQSFGSQGKEVYLVSDRAELLSVMEKLKCVPHLFQKFVAESKGCDVRIIVVGQEVVGAMRRVSNGDFRSNIGAGGRGEPFEVGDELKTIAKKTAAILGLDYCGIDVLFGKDGPQICEVNSNAFFKTFEEVTGVNVAAKYAEYIIKTVKNEV